jgi:hypothetical protein
MEAQPCSVGGEREGKGGLHWGQRWRMGGLTVKRWRRWRLDENRRGGGISSGGSRRGGRVGGGEGGELELGLGRGTERSEAPASSPNRWARGESRRGNGGGSARACLAMEGERGKEGAHGRQPDHGVGVAPSSAVGCGSTRSLRRWACE